METQTISNRYIALLDLLQLLRQEFPSKNFKVEVGHK